MPGRPMMNRLEAEIRDMGGDEVIFDRIAAGHKMGDIAADFGVSRPMIYKWIKYGPEERQKAFEEAKLLSAHAYAEDSDVPLEELHHKGKFTPAEVSLAKERANHRRWIASIRNREEYGEEKQQAGQIINIQELHLSALRQFGSPAPKAQIPAAAVEGEDYEVLPSPTTQTAATPEDITKRAGNATEGTTAEAKDSDQVATGEAA